jgi:D-3-phosphoglycerate dehydrogenase / 2-oxoglutarate reductase
MNQVSEAVVLVTARSFARGFPEIREELERQVGEVRYRPTDKLEQGQLLGEVARANGWIAGLELIDRRLIAGAPHLRVIARYGVGTENVDIPAATEHGIVVTNTPGANSASVAELTIGFLFVLARRIVEADRAVKSGLWPRIDGWGVRGARVGLVGMGAIGKEVAVRALALGCLVAAYDPCLDETFAAAHGVKSVALGELLATSDFVSLHTPSNAETRHLVDEAFLQAMKRGSFLINTARGDLVDERALAEAIQSGHIAGAALDTLCSEPPEPSAALLLIDNVVVTPHMGAHSEDAVAGMSRMAMEDCLAVLRGEPPRFPVGMPGSP